MSHCPRCKEEMSNGFTYDNSGSQIPVVYCDPCGVSINLENIQDRCTFCNAFLFLKNSKECGTCITCQTASPMMPWPEADAGERAFEKSRDREATERLMNNQFGSFLTY